MEMKINSRVKLVDKAVMEKFKIPKHTVGKILRMNGDRITVEFIVDSQRTTIDTFKSSVKLCTSKFI